MNANSLTVTETFKYLEVVTINMNSNNKDIERLLNSLKQDTYYRKHNLEGLEYLENDENNFNIKTMYYPGSYYDLTPIFVLDSCHEFYYQDKDRIVKPIESALEYLEKNSIIDELEEVTPIGHEVPSVREFNFSINDQHKKLYLQEESDVTQELMDCIEDVNLIYAAGSLVTEEMLQKAKSGCLILHLPGIGYNRDNPDLNMVDYRIKSHDRAEKYGLSKVIFPEGLFPHFECYIKK